MTGIADYQCANCGMDVAGALHYCPKCDVPRYAHNRRKVLSADIAHDGQTLADAERQLDALLRQAAIQNFGRVRIITGRGLISQEILRTLDAALWQERIREYRHEEHNPGALIIQMPNAPAH